MLNFLFFFLGILVGGTAVWAFMQHYFDSHQQDEQVEEEVEEPEEDSGLGDYNTQRKRKIDERKDQIIQRIKKEGYIKTGDVQEMFDVSRNTAYRYLSELEEEGVIEQTKEYGRKVRYSFVE